jgi:hypothetical protein
MRHKISQFSYNLFEKYISNLFRHNVILRDYTDRQIIYMQWSEQWMAHKGIANKFNVWREFIKG